MSKENGKTFLRKAVVAGASVLQTKQLHRVEGIASVPYNLAFGSRELRRALERSLPPKKTR